MLRNFRRATSSSSSQTDVAFKDVAEREGGQREDSKEEMEAGPYHHHSPVIQAPVMQASPKSSPESTSRMGALGVMMGHATRRRGQPKTSPQPSTSSSSTSRNPKKLNKSKSAPSAEQSSAKTSGKKRSSGGPSGRNRFSLRRLFCGSPLVAQPLYHAPPGPSTPPPQSSHQQQQQLHIVQHHSTAHQSNKSETSGSVIWRDNLSSCSSLGQGGAQGGGVATAAAAGTLSLDSHATCSTKGGSERLCPLCWHSLSSDLFPLLRNCAHLFCINCLQTYIRIEIQEGRVNLKCPQCSESMHPNDIESLIGDKSSNLITLYETLMIRRLLSIDPDTRWCPGPNCTYAVIATGCASCPKITCERPGCGCSFCYHCGAEWHPNQTCDAARAQRGHSSMPTQSFTFGGDTSSGGGGVDSASNAGGEYPGVATMHGPSSSTSSSPEVKVCPRCNTLIVKMDDGSCNHMTCAVCGTEFCWLCMKEISDLHYLSPSGCTFWGKKPWSRKKKLFWQLGTLVGAPVGIALLAGIAVPAMIIGIPCWVGRKIHNSLKDSNKHKRNCAIVGGVVSSMAVSPLLAGLAVSVGVPILLCYVYGIVPIALCRSDYTKADLDEFTATGNSAAAAVTAAVMRTGVTGGGNNGGSTNSGHDSQAAAAAAAAATAGVGASDAVSFRRVQSCNPSLSLGSGCHLERIDCESLVDVGGAGSAASTRGLPGSILAYKMGDSQSVGGETIGNFAVGVVGGSSGGGVGAGSVGASRGDGASNVSASVRFDDTVSVTFIGGAAPSSNLAAAPVGATSSVIHSVTNTNGEEKTTVCLHDDEAFITKMSEDI